MDINLAACPESCAMFAMAAIVLIVLSIFKADYFRPQVLYFLVQMIMLGIAYLKIVPAMTDFKLNTWLVWGGGMAAFIGGACLAEMVWDAKGGARMPSSISLHAAYSWQTHFLVSFLAFGYFFIGVIGVVSVAGNLVLLTDNPSAWLAGKDSPVLKYADFFTSGAMVVGLYAVASFKSMNPVRWVRNASRFMVVFTIALSFMTFPSRGINMLCFGFVLLLFNYMHGRFTWRSIMVVGLFVLVFFVFVASIKGQYGEVSADDLMDNKMAKSVMLLPYMYVANNYWNLDYAFNRPSDAFEHEWTYGIDAFYGLTHLLQIGDGLQSSFGWDTPFNESVAKIPTLNTIPYLWDAYKDFGYLGLFFEPFFFGLLFGWLYRRMAVAKTPMSILMMCMFSMWIILWNFTTGYKQSMYWVWAFFFVLVCMLSSGNGLLPAKVVSADVVTQKDDGNREVSGQSE